MNETNKELLVKYITGSADESEKIQVEQWLDEDPVNRDYYIRLEQVWRDSLFAGEGGKAINTDKAFGALKEKLGLEQDELAKSGLEKEEEKLEKEAGRVIRVRWYWAAAVIGGLVLAGGLLRYGGNKRGSGEEGSIAYARTIQVSRGDKKRILLEDSTVVWLNAGSSLRIEKGFGAANRNVFLEGEGYFIVHHDHKKVFTVTTRDYTIRDIGTVFNVRTYSADTRFEAAVMEGEVSVEGRFSGNERASQIILSKSQVLKINKKTALSPGIQTAPTEVSVNESLVSVARAAHIESYGGWKDDQLSFDDDNFRDITNKLERRYRVTIRIEDEQLAKIRYTGRFSRIPDVEAVLDVLKETTPISYDRKGDTILIRGHK